jgi:two-component system OmpR family sensor kinase
LPLRLRLALFGAGVVALALVLFGLLLYALLAQGAFTNQDDALRTRAHDAVTALGGAIPAQQPPVAPANLATSTDVFVEVMSADGSPIYTSGVLNGSPPAASQSLLGQAQQHHGALATQGSLRLYVVPFANGYVMTGQSTRVPESNRSGIVVFLVISAIPALLAALIASGLVAGRALAPLKSVAGAAADIGRTRDFGRRLPQPRSRDEVATLAGSFNWMLNQLQDAFESQRRFVADASHELRTPLTTIQGNAGLLSRGPAVADEVRAAAVNDIAQESARMARLVDRLLMLARADSGLRLMLTPTQMKPIIEEVCRQAATLRPDRILEVEVSFAHIDGDEDALRQLLWILLDNALRHARSSVHVRLSLESGWARLMVADDGPGIPAAERERVFERFYRADPSRSGGHAGLGLAIARWIVDQLHGRILAGESPSGGGAFMVDLPLLRPS